MTRRQLLSSAAALARPGPSFDVSRFLMKGEYARVCVTAPSFRFVWHSRFFGFRFCAPPHDERLTYTDFGSFETGGVDLVTAHYHLLTPLDSSGQPLRLNEGRLLLPATQNPACPACRFEYTSPSGGVLAAELRFSAAPPHAALLIDPRGFPSGPPLTLTLPGRLVYDRAARSSGAARYFSTGLKTGLEVRAASGHPLTLAAADGGQIITCQIPVNQPSRWLLTALASDAPVPAAWPAGAAPAFRPAPLASLPAWEPRVMAGRGWSAARGRPRERIAGLFASAENWTQPVSWLPESRFAFLEREFLPKVAAAGSYDAAGLSRDGVTERGENAAWLRLVETAHRLKLRVYMKPGDGELTRLSRPEDIEAWARACFAVAPDRRADAVRLPGEAVLVPWTTANLCLAPRFFTPELLKLHRLDWRAARRRIVSSVADRFSRIIDAIRRHAPTITIDLECCDTPVLETLLQRHENLGVMYMCYGQFPRAAEYLELYQCVASRQLQAARVVLETDCYYTRSITGLGQLRGKPYAELYSPEDLRLMADKHRHLNSLAADAVWIWGLNITHTEAKFEAVSNAYAH